MQEALKFLRDSKVFYLATMDGDQPRARPFGAVAETGGRLYLVTNNQKSVYAQLMKNPKAEICASNSRGEWMRITAELVRDDSDEARARMLEQNESLKNLYSVGDGMMEVFYLKDAVAVFYSFSSEPHTVKF